MIIKHLIFLKYYQVLLGVFYLKLFDFILKFTKGNFLKIKKQFLFKNIYFV